MFNLDLIHCQDCIAGLRNLPAASIDLVVTDPPYLIGYHSGHRDPSHDFAKPIPGDSDPALIRAVVPELYRVMGQDTAAFMACSPRTLPFFVEVVTQHFELKNVIVWDKGNHTCGDLTGAYGYGWEALLLFAKGRPTLRGHRFSDVWSIPRVHNDGRLVHQNQKPVGLIERCIEGWSNRGDVVLDPFMGSGTTAVAAVQLHRHYIGYEIDAATCALARTRAATAQPKLLLDNAPVGEQVSFLSA